jgi:hypothetical protein
MSKTGSYIGGHTVWTKDDLLTEKGRAKAAHKAARKGTKPIREAKQRAAERANDRLAAAAGRALIKAQADAAKAKGPRLELRRITGPDGRKVTVRVWK